MRDWENIIEEFTKLKRDSDFEMLNVELRIMKTWKSVLEILKLVPDLGVLSLVTEVWKLQYSFTLLVKAGMIGLFVEVTILGIVIKGAVLEVTLF